jgi:hypothetical protein
MTRASLSSRWIDALASAREHFQTGDLKEIWERTTIKQSSDLTRIVVPGISGHDGLNLWTIPLVDLPEIEAREILLYILACRASDLHIKGRGWTTKAELVQVLGCLPSTCVNVAERWRKLNCIRNLGELPYAALEDRPICKICGGRVATSAGWKPESTGLDPLVYGAYRPDLHHECKNFALTVLLPRHKAAQQEAARKATAGMDK